MAPAGPPRAMPRESSWRVVLLVLASWALIPSRGHIAPGAIKLDTMTFDKVLKIPGHRFLVKFDQAYAFGQSEHEFKRIAKLLVDIDGMLVGEVPIFEYQSKENDELRVRYNLTKRDYPAYALFKGKQDPEGGTWYKGHTRFADVVGWLRRNGVALPLHHLATIEELDEIAHRFLKNGFQESDIEETREIARSHTEEDLAMMYAHVMERIKAKGTDFIDAEIARLENVLRKHERDGTHIKSKQEQNFVNKIKVLNSFAVPHGTHPTDHHTPTHPDEL